MKKRIAFIDDNEDLLYTIKYGISDLNKDIDVLTYSNPVEFVDITITEKFDLIVLDIMMPELNGWDTLAKIKEIGELNKDTPIIFLTAKVDEQSKKFGSVIANDYITKPFDVNELYKVIKKYI